MSPPLLPLPVQVAGLKCGFALIPGGLWSTGGRLGAGAGQGEAAPHRGGFAWNTNLHRFPGDPLRAGEPDCQISALLLLQFYFLFALFFFIFFPVCLFVLTFILEPVPSCLAELLESSGPFIMPSSLLNKLWALKLFSFPLPLAP